MLQTFYKLNSQPKTIGVKGALQRIWDSLPRTFAI